MKKTFAQTLLWAVTVTALTLVAGQMALAQTGGMSETLSTKSGAVTITAEELSLSGKQGRITFRRDVRVVQNHYRMEADQLVVTLAPTDGQMDRREIQHMVAIGNVTFMYGDRTANAGRAAYTPGTDQVVLTVNPKITGPGVTVAGELIRIDLKTQESTVEGGSFTFEEGQK